MRSNRTDVINRILKEEGGYVNNPKDPGGPTNFGITLTDYRLYINKNGTASDVKNMTKDQAVAIYSSKYWDKLDCDNLASGLDYTCCDYGVNSGLGRPRKALGRFKSLSGTELIDAINNERMTFLRGLGTYSTFGEGWSARVERVRAYSKVLAKKDNTTGPVVGGGTLSLTAWLSQYWHNHETAIIITGVALSLAIATLIHYYRNRNK